jgi:8-hydroxy-5-deazaflavin:NADPH oxidoreductase
MGKQLNMENEPQKLETIAVIGGTGKEGRGLAYRWVRSGYFVLIGSRNPEKAQAAARELSGMFPKDAKIRGLGNLEAAQLADVVVLTVPYQVHQQTLLELKSALQGKLLIDVTVPLVPPQVTTVRMPPAGSAAQEARAILGTDVDICTAFQNISYEHLMSAEELECDILVTGTSKTARSKTLALIAAAGLQGWDAGPLENSSVVEGLTSILIHINRQYGSKHAGIKITGVNEPPHQK